MVSFVSNFAIREPDCSSVGWFSHFSENSWGWFLQGVRRTNLVLQKKVFFTIIILVLICIFTQNKNQLYLVRPVLRSHITGWHINPPSKGSKWILTIRPHFHARRGGGDYFVCSIDDMDQPFIIQIKKFLCQFHTWECRILFQFSFEGAYNLVLASTTL